jgi:hypothetical protein
VISCLCQVLEESLSFLFSLSLFFFFFFFRTFFCEIGSSSSLVLDGKDLKLVSIRVNGKELKVHNFYPTFPKDFQYNETEYFLVVHYLIE